MDAASVASLILTTEAAIVEAPKADAPAMPDMGGMGGITQKVNAARNSIQLTLTLAPLNAV